MQATPSSTNTPEVLTLSIDRFLRAEGWSVTDVARRPDGSGFDVTLTKGSEPDLGRTVTRHAASAGEATLKACSSARIPLSD